MVDVGLAMLISASIGSIAGSVTYLVKDLIENKVAAGYLETSDEVNLGDEIEINGERGTVVNFAKRNVYLLVEPEGEDPYVYEEEIFEVLKNPVRNYTLTKKFEES